MISDKDARRLFLSTQSILDKHGYDRLLANQLYRGSRGPNSWENNHPGGCKRHMSVFKEFNIIPEFCFDCYKVVIEPRTVIELFKLVVLYEKYELPYDNVRKCMAEGREQVSGTYKGLVYCLGLEEGKIILKMLQDMVSQEISRGIQITLKRGCSEYALAYPGYSQIKQNVEAMEYKKEWKILEEIADIKYAFHTRHVVKDTFKRPRYSLHDAEAMFSWLRYAATIGDLSYLKISGRILHPYENLKRPSPFHPVEDK